MGLGNFEPAPSTAAANTGLSAQSKINNLVLQKIQALVAANPQFLTSGIPNQILSQLLMQPMKVVSSNLKTFKNNRSSYELHLCSRLIPQRPL